MAQRVRIPYRGRHVLRLPHNSPSWQHFTQGFLLCSRPTIAQNREKVKRFFLFFRKIFPYFYLGMVMVSTIWLSVSRRSETAGIPLS